MSIKNLPFGELDAFHVVIEIPQGSQDKYEYDEKLDVIKLDRVLFGSQRMPANYGFIPETRAEDGDHSDALVFSTNAFFPGAVVEARAIGMMEMIDNGDKDNKIIAVAAQDPRFSHIQTLDQIGDHKLKEIKNFFETYKELQNKKVEVVGFKTAEEAKEELTRTREVYSKEQGH